MHWLFNTARLLKHQTLDLSVQLYQAIYLNYHLEGYQDTLYAQAHLRVLQAWLILAYILHDCMIYVGKSIFREEKTI